EDVGDVVDREHVARAHHLGADPVDDEADRQTALVQLADHAVGIADRADLGRRHDDRFGGAGDRVAEAVLDPRRTIDQHVVGERRDLVDHLRELQLADRGLVALLRGRQHREVLEPLVLDQRLPELTAPFDHLDEIEDDALLDAEHEVEIAQPDVGVDEDDAMAALRERCAEVRGGGRLADAAFPARDDDAPGAHACISFRRSAWLKGTTTIRLSTIEACSGPRGFASAAPLAIMVAMRSCVGASSSAITRAPRSPWAPACATPRSAPKTTMSPE